jgi:hypothetical protein
MWCTALCPTSVLALGAAVSSYLERVSLRYLPNKTLLHRIRRMDPAGFEPASATWTECCVAVTPRALKGVWPIAARDCKSLNSNFRRYVPDRDSAYGLLAIPPALDQVNDPSVPNFLSVCPRIFSSVISQASASSVSPFLLDIEAAPDPGYTINRL